ncbi:MAG: tRNA (adenosine(37)-N6)-threonylcarbamoyltransferase complex ATPase subunit type 1 TsaE [Candidatus Komeilibacteria bacterium CG_4_9_14_0_8_um_filter_36_9]|uniref:tRNA threonylcarbamoyladenosine biosynthesis protein TsaE n=1 Tax=Candidatus Komeilibacteria bacterium CG_4_9_14_0_8_um_filter_36_9 TaxID=1974473 RepID=A0A2M8DQ79_9BACT|nr:MAG: tRNA (adenosine(37)-N6)-threonylcarbamoyltransferase complex ATPase subunit type 1 TsaE [Candidatus Komeilibacteria bacterium CG_4_9_14_0_8_um_filter_36_9]
MKRSEKSKNEAETLNIAKEMAGKFRGGEVIALTGDLGAGKTIFTKGLAQGLGYKKIITSPTFVLMKVYQPDNPVVTNFVHVDCYRIDSSEDLYGIGFNDYLGRADTVVAIEWAEKVKDVLHKKLKLINVKIKSGRKETERYVEIS